MVAAWPRFVDKIDFEFNQCESNAVALDYFPLVSLEYQKRIRELKIWGWAFFAF